MRRRVNISDRRLSFCTNESGCVRVASAAAKAVVCVCDRRDGAYFEIPAEPYLTFHVYHHPFAYRDFSTVDSEDRRLAA